MKLFLLFCFFPLSVLAAAPSWTEEALRLQSDSAKVRERAFKTLQKDPNLEKTLTPELQGPQKGLAMDTIAALKMTSFLPKLLADAPHDDSGFTYLTINNLITAKNKDDVFRTYEDRIFCSLCRSTPPARVIMLDTLARVGYELRMKDLESLFSMKEWPEVKMAAVDYVRYALLQKHRSQYLSLLQKALKDPVIQVREQSLYLISELKSDDQKKALGFLSECQGLTPAAFELCEKLRGKDL